METGLSIAEIVSSKKIYNESLFQHAAANQICSYVSEKLQIHRLSHDRLNVLLYYALCREYARPTSFACYARKEMVEEVKAVQPSDSRHLLWITSV
jgi:hypothetical protein